MQHLSCFGDRTFDADSNGIQYSFLSKMDIEHYSTQPTKYRIRPEMLVLRLPF